MLGYVYCIPEAKIGQRKNGPFLEVPLDMVRSISHQDPPSRENRVASGEIANILQWPRRMFITNVCSMR